MALPLPRSLSPSSLSNFTSCGLQFRFTAVERLPETASVAATRGTLVHSALEVLFGLPAHERRPERAEECLQVAAERMRTDPQWIELGLSDDDQAAMLDDSRKLLNGYFALEDPATVQAIGLELKMEVDIGGVTVRGIIDRLDLVDGELVVTDYKTGRAPGDNWARQKMLGVHVYSLMCEQTFGRRPVRVQLLHLAEPVAIVAEPTGQSSAGLTRKLQAVWRAVETACENDDFQARPSPACNWCSFQKWCPAFGGDPDQAARDLAAAIADEAADAAGQLRLVTT